jgi:hypothetical protein
MFSIPADLKDTTYGIHWYTLATGTINPNNQWMLKLGNLQYSGISIANSAEAPTVYFDYRTDALLFTSSIYSAVTSAMVK